MHQLPSFFNTMNIALLQTMLTQNKIKFISTIGLEMSRYQP